MGLRQKHVCNNIEQTKSPNLKVVVVLVVVVVVYVVAAAAADDDYVTAFGPVIVT
jgi:hypothetical protein